jgi:hypothetical protein
MAELRRTSASERPVVSRPLAPLEGLAKERLALSSRTRRRHTFVDTNGVRTVVGTPIHLLGPNSGIRLIDAGLVTLGSELDVRGPSNSFVPLVRKVSERLVD